MVTIPATENALDFLGALSTPPRIPYPAPQPIPPPIPIVLILFGVICGYDYPIPEPIPHPTSLVSRPPPHDTIFDVCFKAKREYYHFIITIFCGLYGCVFDLFIALLCARSRPPYPAPRPHTTVIIVLNGINVNVFIYGELTSPLKTTIDIISSPLIQAPDAANFDKCIEGDGTSIPCLTPAPITAAIAATNFKNCFEKEGTVVPQTHAEAQPTAWIVLHGIYCVEKEKE